MSARAVDSAVMSVSARPATDGRSAATATTPTRRMNRSLPRDATIGSHGWCRTAQPRVVGHDEQRIRRGPGRRRRHGPRHVRAVALAASALDQGLVTGLSTGLHFLLAAGRAGRAGGRGQVPRRRDAVTGRSPHRDDRGGLSRRCPLGLAVLRALPPRRPRTRSGEPLRQAGWRLGATGLGGALLGGAETGAHALDDRLRLGGRLAAVPLAVPVGLGVRLRPGPRRGRRGRARPTRRARPPPALRSLAVAGGSRRRALRGVAYGEHALTDLRRPPAGAVLPGRPSSGGWPATPASSPGWAPAASAVWHRAMQRDRGR